MAIITKAGTPSKGSPTQFTLDKAELAAVTSVAASSYYSDSTNWKEVILNYKSSTGNQSEILKFDAALASPTANFAVSAKARDIFQIHKIIIKDFDGGSFEVPRLALTTAEFDVDMSAPTVFLPQWTKSRPSYLSDYQENGLISNISGFWNNGAYAVGISGDFTITMDISILQTGIFQGDVMFGYLKTPTDLIGGLSVVGNSNISRTVYLDQGTSFSNYSGGFSNISGYFAFTAGTVILVMTRVGSTITFSLSQGVNTMTGTMETSNSGTIHPYFLPYSQYTRLNSISTT